MLPSGQSFLVYIVRKSINTSEVMLIISQNCFVFLKDYYIQRVRTSVLQRDLLFLAILVTFLVEWVICLFLIVGVLILSLDKDTYEQLGLTGKPSAFQKNHRFSKCNITVGQFMSVIVLSYFVFINCLYIFHIFSYCVHISSVESFKIYFVWQVMNVW